MLPPRLALIASVALSSLLVVNAIPTGQNHGHNSLLNNGQSCNTSVSCMPLTNQIDASESTVRLTVRP